MPLDPSEVVRAVAALIKTIPLLIRWRHLTTEERRKVLDDLADTVATLALDAMD